MLNKSTLFKILFEIVDYLNQHGEKLVICIEPKPVEKPHVCLVLPYKHRNQTKEPWIDKHTILH